MKNNDKKDKKNKKNKSKFNDYTSFLNPEIVASDPQGMYTGVPADTNPRRRRFINNQHKQ